MKIRMPNPDHPYKDFGQFVCFRCDKSINITKEDGHYYGEFCCLTEEEGKEAQEIYDKRSKKNE